MGHYAKVRNGAVVDVIVASSDFFNNFVDDSPGQWVKTSYNTRRGKHYDPSTGEESADQSKALRKNYAGIGFLYDGVGFYPPKPFDSWTFDSATYTWEAPVEFPGNLDPTDTKKYEWNEADQRWDEVT